MPPVVILERGHHGKRHDERGATSGDLVEEVLVREYMRRAEDDLRAAGARVIVQSSGTSSGYSDRWARARTHRADVYVQCHVNAGGGSYGLAGHDYRSKTGPELARLVAGELEGLEELERVLALPTYPKGHPEAARRWPADPDWTERMWNVIQGVYAGTPVGLVYEPGFIDTRAHASLWREEGLERVGAALARGVARFLKLSAG